MKLKILTVVGARPQFIKSAAISRAIAARHADAIVEVVVHTGQHYDPNMSEVFFTEMNIPKEAYNLEIGSANHANQTAQMMMAIDGVVNTEKPDAVLLYGDTNSTLAACLVAVKRHIPIIHIEAGVRGYNKLFPEEVNRLICDHTASMLFVPTDAGIDSLRREGFDITENKPIEKSLMNHPRVYKCGDIMYDNTLFFRDKADDYFEKLRAENGLPASDFFLVTSHRPSNVDDPAHFEEILRFFNYAIDELGKSIVFPIHPRTQALVNGNSQLSKLLNRPEIHAIPAVSFIEMIALEKYADLVVTDSGGVQKEAYFMEKPCLIMLDETPWTELVESGNARLVGHHYDKLCAGAAHYLTNGLHTFPAYYGDGNAADFICQKIISDLSHGIR